MDKPSMEFQRQALLNSKIIDLLDLQGSERYVDIMVNFVPLAGGDMLKFTPPIRIVLNKKPSK